MSSPVVLSDQRYWSVFHGAPDAMYVIAPGGVVVEANRRAEELEGRPRDAIVGRPMAAYMQTQEPTALLALFAASADAPEVRELVPMRRGNGDIIVVEMSAQAVGGGERRTVVAIARDVTEKQRTLRQLHLLQQICVAVAEQPDLPTALGAVLALVGRSIDWTSAVAWLPRRRGPVLDPAATWSRDEATAVGFASVIRKCRARAGVGVVGRAFESRLPIWVEDLHTDSDPTSFDASATGMHGALAVPVLAGDEVVAVLECFLSDARARDPFAVELMTAVAAQIASAVHRRRTEEALTRTEEGLRHAQKMESIARLTGGIAHDFNNLLAAILGYASLLEQEMSPEDGARADVHEIRHAAESAAKLTRQLLMFSRRQMVEPVVLPLNGVVSDVEKLLRRVIGEDVELVTSFATGLGCVRADAGQLQQVVMNLVINARDAMPDGGRITIETGEATIDPERAQQQGGVAPGRYVFLSVADTGQGIDAATRARLFEPFFTTKPVGQGTGLGLSTCQTIVTRGGGFMTVDSAPGRGTTFHVYLPRVGASAEATAAGEGTPAPRGGSETVLLVEDDAPVRALLQRTLEEKGYVVLTAAHGEEALARWRAHATPIDLVVSDVVMPGLNGLALVRRLTAADAPQVLLMSGYPDDSPARSAAAVPNGHFIAKPFAPELLARKVRELLDAHPRPAGRDANPPARESRC